MPGRLTPAAPALLLAVLALAGPPQALARPPSAPQPDPELLAALDQALSAPHSFRDAAEAQVWLLDMGSRLQRRVPDPAQRMRLLRAVHREAARAEVPPEMVLAVIEIESGFEPTAISRVGARGLMQVMPFWKRELGREEDNLLHLETNLRYGCTILAHYRDRERGDWRRALNRYNGRLHSNPYADKVLEALRHRWYRQ